MTPDKVAEKIFDFVHQLPKLAELLFRRLEDLPDFIALLLQSQHVEFSGQETPGLTEIPRSVLAKVTLRF